MINVFFITEVNTLHNKLNSTWIILTTLNVSTGSVNYKKLGNEESTKQDPAAKNTLNSHLICLSENRLDYNMLEKEGGIKGQAAKGMCNSHPICHPTFQDTQYRCRLIRSY